MKNTKNNRNRSASIISMLFVFAIAITSCSKDDSATTPTEQNQSLGLIKVTGEDASVATKTILNGLETIWVAGDVVGVFSPQAKTNINHDVNNVSYVATTSAKSSAFTGNMVWGLRNEDHNFYAYYPFNSLYTAIDGPTKMKVELRSDQTQSSESNTNLKRMYQDFMVATPITVSPGAAGVATSGINFTFNHLFTIVEFKITGSGSLKIVELTTPNPIAFTDGTVDLTQAPVIDTPYAITKTGESASIQVVLEDIATLNESTPVSVYMVVSPGLQVGNCTINLFDGVSWKTISKPAPEGGFKRGKKYIVEVNAATMPQESVEGKMIGDDYLGGKLAYIFHHKDTGYDPHVLHGIIAATADQGSSIPWYVTREPSGYYDDLKHAVGTGLYNTNRIITIFGNVGYYAAKVCRDYDGGTYTDWCLPSLDDLNKLFLNRALIGGFTNKFYWSSNQRYAGYGYCQNFNDGITYARIQDYTTDLYVRAVRYF